MLCDDDDGVHIRTPRSRHAADASLAEVPGHRLRMQMLCDDDDGVHIRTPRSHDDADAALYSVAFLYYLLALAGSILTLYPLIKFLFIAPITFSATSSGTSTKVNLS